MTAPLCDRPNEWGEPIGMPCPDCGHSALLHPGPGSGGPDVCVMCRMLDQADRMDALLKATQRYRDELAGLVGDHRLTRSIALGYWEERMSDGSTIRHPMPKASVTPVVPLPLPAVRRPAVP